MGSISYTPPTKAIAPPVIVAEMNIFEKVGLYISGFFEACGDFMGDPVSFPLEVADTIATFLIDNTEIFILVAIVGMYCVMRGKRELGGKIVGKVFWVYIIAKVVAGYL